MTNIYNDNDNRIIRLDKDSKRMNPFLFNSRSAILDGEWKQIGCSIQDIFHARSTGKTRVSDQKSVRLKNSIMAIANSFEFVTTVGIARLFKVDRATAYRVIKAVPHVKSRGQIAVVSTYGPSAIFHLLMKNMYAMHRTANGKVHDEEFHFLKADEISSRDVGSGKLNRLRFSELVKGYDLPPRTQSMLSAERKANRKISLRPIWIGAIPFMRNPPRRAREKSISITFCEFTGVPIGNYRIMESIYKPFMNEQTVSPMFPKRRDHARSNIAGFESILELVHGNS